MTTTILRRAAVLATALVAFGTGAQAASASDLDQTVYDTGLAPGEIEHGVMSSSITGSSYTYDWRVEYWVSADRWREQTTDAKTGELLNGRIGDSSGTTWLQYKPINGDPRVLHFAGRDSIPGPGWPAPYNAKVLAGGVTQGPDTKPIAVTFQPIGPRTIAGFAGTEYELLANGGPAISSHGNVAHATVVLQNGTAQPLLREWVIPNGGPEPFRQREVLLSRELTSSRSTDVLTRSALSRTISRWKAKVKALKASKKKHKK